MTHPLLAEPRFRASVELRPLRRRAHLPLRPTPVPNGGLVSPSPQRTQRLLPAAVTEQPLHHIRRWSRLDRFSRAVAHLTAGLLDGDPPQLSRRLGYSLTTLYGCHETNSDVYDVLMARGAAMVPPQRFAYTLPGAALAEVSHAFDHHIEGETQVLCGGPLAVMSAMVGACDALRCDARLGAMLVAAVDVLGPATLRQMATAPSSVARAPWAEGAAAMLLVAPGTPGPLPAYRLRLSSFAPADSRALAAAAQLVRAGRRPPEKIFVCSDAPATIAHFDEALRNPGPQGGVVAVPWRTGDAGAATGMHALLMALECLDDGAEAAAVVAESASAVMYVEVETLGA